jgi:hypothetical protein
MTQFVIRGRLEDILGAFASTGAAFNQVLHLHGRPFGTVLPRIVRQDMIGHHTLWTLLHAHSEPKQTII